MSEQPPTLHPLVEGFADAERYDRGRPVYGEETTALLLEAIELRSGDPVLELGAGTGQLSRALIAAGLDLVAVEPLGPTRELLKAAIGAERVREGVAEAIPMPDRSVRAVFAADSFHWFDETLAMAELRRVLVRRGGVAILRTLPAIDEPWSADLGKILVSMGVEHPIYTERAPAFALEQDDAFGEVIELKAQSERSTDRDGLLAYFSTISWIATLEAARREAMLAEVAELLDRNGVDVLTHPVNHQIWIARLKA
jgi:SAM-dependent methyltransferase